MATPLEPSRRGRHLFLLLGFAILATDLLLFSAFCDGQIISIAQKSAQCIAGAPGPGPGYPYSPIPSGSDEPLSACQWNLQLLGVDSALYAKATGKGVRVGVLDSGVDFTHPDLAGAIDHELACSFIFDDDPLADPREMANGDCSNKAAVQDRYGHGTHVSTIIAARLNGAGNAGVAPEATIVPIKVCSFTNFCFLKSVAAGIRYAGDLALDVINLSLYADPYLFYCKNDAEQRAMLKTVQDAATYAQQRGVVIVVSGGNENNDLTHPRVDTTSPDYPFDAPILRNITNACRVAPAELPGVITVSAVGPKPQLASYSNVGMKTIDVAGPGGDLNQYGPLNALGGVVAGWSSTDQSGSWELYANPSFSPFGTAVVDGNGARYVSIQGTSMAAPHVAGVAALIRQLNPGLAPAAVNAILKRTATPLACPVDMASDPGLSGYPNNCTGGPGKTSFYGAGIVSAGGAVSK